MGDFRMKLRGTTRGGGGGGARAVLQPSDITFLGYKKFSNSGISRELTNSSGGAVFRRVGSGDDDIRFFLNGQWGGVYEYSFGTGTGDTTLASAPTMATYRDWGYPFGSAIRLTVDDGSDAGYQVDCGLKWDAARNALWKTYSQLYVATNHPALVCTILNDSTGAATPYGPWRLTQSASMHRASIIDIPSDFTTEFLGGANVAGMGAMNSGTASMPFGPNLHHYTLPDPTTLPASSALDSSVAIASGTLIQADITHRRTRTANYKTCGWTAFGGVNYDCRNGAGITTGATTWGGADPGSAENDTASCGCWVQTSTKEGLVYFGFMVDTPPGYTAVGDPDGQVHMWYGDYLHATATGSTAAGYENYKCCHGQSDLRWTSTGPGAHYRDGKMWIFSRSQLGNSATGATAPDAVYPAATEASRLAAAFPTATSLTEKVETFNVFGSQMSFDAQTNRIYATQFLYDPVHGHGHPVLLVFQVS